MYQLISVIAIFISLVYFLGIFQGAESACEEVPTSLPPNSRYIYFPGCLAGIRYKGKSDNETCYCYQQNSGEDKCGYICTPIKTTTDRKVRSTLKDESGLIAMIQRQNKELQTRLRELEEELKEEPDEELEEELEDEFEKELEEDFEKHRELLEEELKELLDAERVA